MKILRSVSLLVLASLALSASAQNLVVNPGFETGDFTGWTATAAKKNSDFGVSSAAAYSGNFGARFSANGNRFDFLNSLDVITQEIPTVPGQAYRLSFYLRDTSVGAVRDRTMNVIFGSFVSSMPGSIGSDFTLLSYIGIASSTSTTLYFEGYNLNGDYQFDDISVLPSATVVPEPASIAALGLGVAALLRRRKRS